MIIGHSDFNGARSVELFCGIGGFKIGADRVGLETIWANDFDPDAIHTYEAAWPETDLAQGPLEDFCRTVPAHDVLTAGFPCQPFSSAGKKRAHADPRATSVGSLLDVLERRRPDLAVLENVPFLISAHGGRWLHTVINALAGLGYTVEWRVVNAADVGHPQFRPRVIFVCSRGTHDPQLLMIDDEDVMATEQPEGGRPPSWGRLSRGHLTSLTSSWRGDWGHLAMASMLEDDVDPRFDFTSATLARLPSSTPVNRKIRGVEVLFNQRGGSRMGYTVYGTGGLAPTLTATSSRHYERYRVDQRYRRLTPGEYLALQGFPRNHCDMVPLAKRYVLAGNAIPTGIATWALARATRVQDIQAIAPVTGRVEVAIP